MIALGIFCTVNRGLQKSQFYKKSGFLLFVTSSQGEGTVRLISLFVCFPDFFEVSAFYAFCDYFAFSAFSALFLLYEQFFFVLALI